MNNELKQTFTRRLSQCNRGEMIVIVYEILFAHLDDAKQAFEENRHEDFKAGIRRTNACLDRLMGALNFKYELSNQLQELYVFSKSELSKALYENKIERILTVERILKRLYASFKEVAKSDTSGPIMTNIQQVYAGFTYGRDSVNENLMENNNQRGFFV